MQMQLSFVRIVTFASRKRLVTVLDGVYLVPGQKIQLYSGIASIDEDLLSETMLLNDLNISFLFTANRAVSLQFLNYYECWIMHVYG